MEKNSTIIQKTDSEVELMSSNQLSDNLYNDVCSIIENTRHRLATYANKEICMTNWNVGNRIKQDVLRNKRAEYGKSVLKVLSDKLTIKYGKGWGYQKLQHCVRSAYTFSEDDIVYATRTQLTWTHLRSLMSIENSTERQFYMQMCSYEHWDTRTLNAKIDSQLYQRTALSRQPENVIRQELDKNKESGRLIPDMVFRSSYFLDALSLPDVFTEKDLENAIITQIEVFIQELGSDFTFVARQKRISIDAVDYYLDLLFFHRELRRMVAIDLKLGKFRPEHEGQMLLYLRYLDKNERKPWEESPIGIILCSEGNTEHIEYLMLDKDSPIKVAQYYTQLPDKKVLADRLKKAILIAKEHCNDVVDNR